jgi:glucose-6-phosphate isomerase
MNPTQTAAWKALESHATEASRLHLRDLLQDPKRFEAQSVRLDDLLLFDYSKHRVTEETLGLLEQLFLETGAAEGFAAQLRGEKINATEGRAVLHTALRDPRSEPLWVDGQDARALGGGGGGRGGPARAHVRLRGRCACGSETRTHRTSLHPRR